MVVPKMKTTILITLIFHAYHATCSSKNQNHEYDGNSLSNSLTVGAGKTDSQDTTNESIGQYSPAEKSKSIIQHGEDSATHTQDDLQNKNIPESNDLTDPEVDVDSASTDHEIEVTGSNFILVNDSKGVNATDTGPLPTSQDLLPELIQDDDNFGDSDDENADETNDYDTMEDDDTILTDDNKDEDGLPSDETLSDDVFDDTTSNPQNRAPSPSDEIAIVGAGPAGLHMAYLLKQKGFRKITILEKSTRIGGMSRTISYRGVPHELGTCYFSPDYDELLSIAKKYNLTTVPLPEASAWFDNQSKPISFSAYLVHSVMTTYNITNPLRAVKKLSLAIMKYITIHTKLFGNYEGELMPEPSRQVKYLIRGTFHEFLARNKLTILIPLFHGTFTIQGYGHSDEVAALYGLLWNTPKLLGAMLKRIQGITTTSGIGMLRDGFENFWRELVHHEGLRIKFNVDIRRIRRYVSRKRKCRRRRKNCAKRKRNRGAVKICTRQKRGKGRCSIYNFVIWSPEMKLSLPLWDARKDERRLFRRTTSTYFTTAITNSEGQSRGESPVDYWIDNMRNKREHSVWAQRNSFGVMNGQYGSNYRDNNLRNGADTRSIKTTVTYQMGGYDPRVAGIKLETIVRNHFSKSRMFNILNMGTWRYFPRYSPKQIQNGILWRILDLQGKYNMWYIGSSVSFESVKSVMDYNKLLVRTLIDGKPHNSVNTAT